MRRRLAWMMAVAVLSLPVSSSASALDPAAALERPTARSAAQYFGAIVWITANSRSANGQYLRVAIQNSGSGVTSPAVLKAPENRAEFPNLRRAQQWRVERNHAADAPYAVRFRNIYSDKCLTAARPHGSPVYLQGCGSILGQAWLYKPNGMIWSMNYNQTFPAGCSCTTLDIPNFRNVIGTRLVVARHTGTWNQIWDVDIVPTSLR